MTAKPDLAAVPEGTKVLVNSHVAFGGAGRGYGAFRSYLFQSVSGDFARGAAHRAHSTDPERCTPQLCDLPAHRFPAPGVQQRVTDKKVLRYEDTTFMTTGSIQQAAYFTITAIFGVVTALTAYTARQLPGTVIVLPVTVAMGWKAFSAWESVTAELRTAAATQYLRIVQGGVEDPVERRKRLNAEKELIKYRGTGYSDVGYALPAAKAPKPFNQGVASDVTADAGRVGADEAKFRHLVATTHARTG